MTFIPGAREIPDPEAEIERLAAARRQQTAGAVLGFGDVIRVLVKSGEVLTGRIVAVDLKPTGDGRAGFVLLAEPLDP